MAKTSADADMLTRKSCTVAFAPAAVKAPIAPTIKYEYTIFCTPVFLLLYLLKSGILLKSLVVVLDEVASADAPALADVVVDRARKPVFESVRGIERIIAREAMSDAIVWWVVRGEGGRWWD